MALMNGAFFGLSFIFRIFFFRISLALFSNCVGSASTHTIGVSKIESIESCVCVFVFVFETENE